MKGHNYLELSQAETNCAIETYLNEHVLQPEHKITVENVTVRENVFRVVIQKEETQKDPHGASTTYLS
jgi:hypothetical protein